MQNAKLRTLGQGSLILLAAALTLSAADPFMGTWNVNLAKSKYSPGPGPKSSTVTYSQDSDWIVAKIDTVNAEGTPTSSTVRYRRDGKEYPYEAPAGKGTIAVTSMNANTAHATIKVGTATTTVHTVIAKDGKSFSRTTKGTDAQGRTVNNLVVFEKQ